ncbi:uncharacterized protein TRIADDRAFT_52125 [Trichoplax adhaerens]|uniref:SAM domain-containing protein n=1 Tax=Trichoplax adhaerens TaxID=10228 RepID=B3RLU3_TRIAD|nr:hypothetical protein TRIADDRAFT_52125 [Trichoplax adhaerens]EDV29584.1 hypothetical protein TRIADDRAFT_52125 [Trichoplax adhaerens]|eukprot:XP_002108786.1 hypothetical protein TRIADDRAFT_52125 [Trichoplax adhaerens]
MSDASDLAGRLDNNWVMRWLDDIGLPQYKEVMNTAKVDGRILNYLTLDRKEDEDVMVWTNGHIIEWLRSNDIAEYASNLRSSGVHGALFSLEPLFNSDTLIELLNIPIGEVRLHRQTATLFNALIGPECQLTKKQAEAETGTELLLSLARQQKALKMPSSVVSFKNGKLVHGDILCPIGENDDPMPPRKPPRVFLSNNRTLRDRSFSNDVIARTESLSIHNSGR